MIHAMDDVIYLDHNATTPCDPRVVEAMLPFFTEKAANPTSRSHRPGLEASVALEAARSVVVRSIGGRSASEIVFTASATEANNLALFGAVAALRDRGAHIISQRTEHASVLGPLRELERRGWKVSLIGVDPHGRVRLDELEGAFRDDTVLVSLMLANNETGVVQPVVEAAGLAEYERVLVADLTNGARYETYVILGKRGSGAIEVNGAAAHLSQVGNKVIIMAFTWLTQQEWESHRPVIVQPDEANRL